MPTPPAADGPIARARALAPLLRECAEEAERERRLPERAAVAMAEAGLYRVAVPRELGGLECDPRTQIETIEAVAAADGSAGWNLMIGIENMGFLGPALPREVAAKVFSDPLLIVAGALNPLGKATPAPGGFRVSGRWPFASGCHNAHWFWGQCVVGDGSSTSRPTLGEALIPRSEFEIVDTWRVGGLRGSGSHDVSVRDVFVPAERMTAAMAAPRLLASPLFRMPPLVRLAYNKVGVATGIARAALDHFAELAAATRRRGASLPLRDQPAVRMAVAEAEIGLRSARAFVLEAVGSVWDATLAGTEVQARDRALVHLACSHAVRASARAVERVHEAAGSRANFEGHPLERRLRDVRVVGQHITVSSQWLASSAGVLLGLESELPFG